MQLAGAWTPIRRSRLVAAEPTRRRARKPDTALASEFSVALGEWREGS